MVDPSFAMFWANDVPKYVSEDGKAQVTCWFGDYFLNENENGNGDGDGDGEDEKKRNSPPENSWANDPSNDVAVLRLIIQPGGSLVLPPSKVKNVNRSLYLVEGYDHGVKVGEEIVQEKVVLEMDPSKEVTISVQDDASGAVEFLMLQGKPIDEPVAQHGPFVMNTWAEISQAFDDYGETKFGGWPWPSDEMVFPQEKGRFALLDGVETFPTGEESTDDGEGDDDDEKKTDENVCEAGGDSDDNKK